MGASWCSFSRSARLSGVLASLLLSLVVALPAWADGRAWDLSGLPAQMRVGDRVELRLVEPLRDGETLVIPEQTDLKSGLLIEALQDGSSGIAVTLVQPGTLSVPALQVMGATSGVDASGALTEPVSLEVGSAISDKDEKAKEIEPPIDALDLPLSGFWRSVLVLGVLALLAAIVWGVRRYLAWRKQLPAMPAAAAAPELSSEEWAVRELNRISAEEAWSTGNFKRHYFAVSDVLKEFIARRFAFDAQESLADEIVRELERQGRPPESLDQLEALFATLDRVKFTDFKPDWSEPPRVVEDTLGWIRRARV